ARRQRRPEESGPPACRNTSTALTQSPGLGCRRGLLASLHSSLVWESGRNEHADGRPHPPSRGPRPDRQRFAASRHRRPPAAANAKKRSPENDVAEQLRKAADSRSSRKSGKLTFWLSFIEDFALSRPPGSL